MAIKIYDKKTNTFKIISSGSQTSGGNSDVDLSGLATKNELNTHINNKNNPHQTKLRDLYEVGISSLLNGDIIKYDSSKGKFINAQPSTCGQSSDGKSKINAESTADYLVNLLNSSTFSIDYANNKINCTSLDGLTVTIDELNRISGLDENLMTKFSTLVNGNISTYNIPFSSYENLKLFNFSSLEPERVYLMYVSKDETQNNDSTVYMCTNLTNSTDKLPAYAGLRSSEHRDLKVDKVDLTLEVKNKLPQSNIDMTDIVKKPDLNNYIDKTTYDTNNNGIVDKAETLDGLISSTEEIDNAVDKTHEHLNKELLDNIIDTGDGKKILSNAGTYISIEDIYDEDIGIDFLTDEEIDLLNSGIVNEIDFETLVGEQTFSPSLLSNNYNNFKCSCDVNNINSYRAFDGDDSSYFFIDLADYGSSKSTIILQYKKEFRMHGFFFNALNVSNVSLYVSNDGEDYDKIGTYTENNNSDYTYDIRLADTLKYKYYKFEFQTTENVIWHKNNDMTIYDIKFYTYHFSENIFSSEQLYNRFLFTQKKDNLQSSKIDVLEARSQVGKELKYGYSYLSEDFPCEVGDKINFSNFEGTIDYNEDNSCFTLTGEMTYEIELGGLNSGSGAKLYDLTNSKYIVENKCQGNSIQWIYKPDTDINICIKCENDCTIPKNAYFSVKEIYRTFIYNDVKEVDTDSGISDTPVGTVIDSIATKEYPSKNYLTCDGSIYNISSYLELADFIYEQYGSYNIFGGDGVSTFAVPNIDSESKLALVPTLSSIEGLNGKCFSSSEMSPYNNYKVFDGSASTFWVSSHVNQDQYIGYEFNIETIVFEYEIWIRNFDSYDIKQSPKSWNFEGYDTKTQSWVVLDSREDISFISGDKRFFSCNKSGLYKKYRLNITNNGMNDMSQGVSISELQIYSGCKKKMIKYKSCYYMNYHNYHSRACFDKVILFQGEAKTVKLDYELTDSITNYDFITIEARMGTMSDRHMISTTFDVSTFYPSVNPNTNDILFPGFAGRYISLNFGSSPNKFQLNEKYNYNNSDVAVTKIWGIKGAPAYDFTQLSPDQITQLKSILGL